MRKQILVDFDGVIVDVDLDKKFIPPTDDYDRLTLKKNCRLILEKLSKEYDIIIYTGRISSKWGRWSAALQKLKLRKFLSKNRIPFTDIIDKPHLVHYIIDDVAIRFKNWKQAEKELLGDGK